VPTSKGRGKDGGSVVAHHFYSLDLASKCWNGMGSTKYFQPCLLPMVEKFFGFNIGHYHHLEFQYALPHIDTLKCKWSFLGNFTSLV